LAKVLAGETSNQEFGVRRKIVKISYISFDRKIGKSSSEDRASRLPYLAKQRRLVAGRS